MPKYRITAPDGKTYEVTAPDGATEDEIIQYAQKNYAQPKQQAQGKEPSLSEMLNMAPKLGGVIGMGDAYNALGGALRGAGSIGSTLISGAKAVSELSPLTLAKQYLKGENLGGGLSNILSDDAARREAMTGGLQELGVNPESKSFDVGKIGAEIAGTMGTGGLLANTARAALSPAMALKLAPLLSSIQTSGMSAGGATGLGGLAARAVGGAITGGASAGMIDPRLAGQGLAYGAATPLAIMGAGKVGQGVNWLVGAPKQSPEMVGAINAARREGLVIPPSQANPNLKNRLLEGISGKLTTAQNASAKNKDQFERMAAAGLGLPASTKVTPEILSDIRKTAGADYEAVASTGIVTPTQKYADALDSIAKPFKTAQQGFPNAKPSPVIDLVESLRSPQFDASSAVAKISELRSMADDAFRSGSKDVGRASKKAADALEDVLDSHLVATGQIDLLPAFREARKLIAKTYSVENALNKVTGSIDPMKLASQLQRGKPLTGELKDIAEFAARFPKASQTVEKMGSLPQTSPLDWGLGSITAATTMNPLAMASVATRPMLRAGALSPYIQNRLIQQPIPQIPTQLQQFGYQAAPALINR
jgi:hypothetical protein